MIIAITVKSPIPNESIAEPADFNHLFTLSENRIKGIWPWVGGAAALIIILLVAAWFFFPEKVNRILAGKSSEIVTTEEQIPDESIVSGPGTEAGGDDQSAAESAPETGPDQEALGAEADEASDAPEETTIQEEITEEKYEEMASQVKPIFSMNGHDSGSEFDLSQNACAGGACSVRD